MAPRRSTLDWILEAISAATLLAIFGIVAADWAELPAQVPLHFGLSGNPDRWGNKSGILLLPLTAAGLYAGLTMASRYQRFINIPFVIDRNAPAVQSLLLGMSITLKTILLLINLFLVRSVVRTAMGRSDGLGKQFLFAELVPTFLLLGFYLVKLRRYRS
jgi:uncharacterized membrane protein